MKSYLKRTCTVLLSKSDWKFLSQIQPKSIALWEKNVGQEGKHHKYYGFASQIVFGQDYDDQYQAKLTIYDRLGNRKNVSNQQMCPVSDSEFIKLVGQSKEIRFPDEQNGQGKGDRDTNPHKYQFTYENQNWKGGRNSTNRQGNFDLHKWQWQPSHPAITDSDRNIKLIDNCPVIYMQGGPPNKEFYVDVLLYDNDARRYNYARMKIDVRYLALFNPNLNNLAVDASWLLQTGGGVPQSPNLSPYLTWHKFDTTEDSKRHVLLYPVESICDFADSKSAKKDFLGKIYRGTRVPSVLAGDDSYKTDIRYFDQDFNQDAFGDRKSRGFVHGFVHY